MKIGGLLKHSFCDYPGKIAAVVFTQGCNFNCAFCHNKELIAHKGENKYSESFIFNFLDLRRNQLDGVVISGGEPLIQKNIVPFIQKIKQMGFLVKIDTNGSMPSVLAKLIKKNLIDYIAMDIKSSWIKYDQLSGIEVNIDSIKESLKLISESGIDHHFRTTFYKKMLSKKDLQNIKSLIPENSKYVVQKYENITKV